MEMAIHRKSVSNHFEDEETIINVRANRKHTLEKRLRSSAPLGVMDTSAAMTVEASSAAAAMVNRAMLVCMEVVSLVEFRICVMQNYDIVCCC